MVLRGVLVVAVAVTACACATSTTPERGAPGAFYVVGDHAPLLGASADSGKMTEGQFSVVKRIYWFFAGR